MIKTDATVMLFSDSQQQRASAYHRGEPDDVVTLLADAGVDDPDFGQMIFLASLRICDKLEKRGVKEIPAEVEEAQAKKERRDKNLKILLREED